MEDNETYVYSIYFNALISFQDYRLWKDAISFKRKDYRELFEIHAKFEIPVLSKQVERRRPKWRLLNMN